MSAALTSASSLSSLWRIGQLRKTLRTKLAELQSNEVSKAVKITQRIHKMLPVRIPPSAYEQPDHAISTVGSDGPQFRYHLITKQYRTVQSCVYHSIAQQRYCDYQATFQPFQGCSARSLDWFMSSRASPRFLKPPYFVWRQEKKYLRRTASHWYKALTDFERC